MDPWGLLMELVHQLIRASIIASGLTCAGNIFTEFVFNEQMG